MRIITPELSRKKGIHAGLLDQGLVKFNLEARGIFWIWFIHFLQNVAMFFALFVIVAAQLDSDGSAT
ncbi:MAG: hypothetical protein KC496_12475 [Anaerolineae bacterium]|nr:hypothetical protein [Anaerolineae bacterium]